MQQFVNFDGWQVWIAVTLITNAISCIAVVRLSAKLQNVARHLLTVQKSQVTLIDGTKAILESNANMWCILADKLSPK